MIARMQNPIRDVPGILRRVLLLEVRAFRCGGL
jgi:hypothetical protein